MELQPVAELDAEAKSNRRAETNAYAALHCCTTSSLVRKLHNARPRGQIESSEQGPVF